MNPPYDVNGRRQRDEDRRELEEVAALAIRAARAGINPTCILHGPFPRPIGREVCTCYR